jgi:hypothetical protein
MGWIKLGDPTESRIERLVGKCKELGLDPDEIIPFWISEVSVSHSGTRLAEKYGERFWRIFKEFPEEPELGLTDEQLSFYKGRIQEIRKSLEK